MPLPFRMCRPVMIDPSRPFRVVAVLLGLAAVACSSVPEGIEIAQAPPHQETGQDRMPGPGQSAFGPNGISFGGGRDNAPEEGAVLGVNAYLWRASLDTVSFMPVASADPFGGTIITDWYNPPTTPGERYKLNIYILGRELRSDGVRVSMFKQTIGANGWTDEPTTEAAATALEDQILTRARQLRIAGLQVQ